MSDYLDPNNEELLKDFFVEAQLQVELLEQNILVLEHDAANHGAVDEIFRAAHTLKGASGTVQMSEISQFTHLVEDVLDEIRGGKVLVTETVVDTLLTSIDIIKAMISERSAGAVYDDDTTAVQQALNDLLPEQQRKREAAAPKKPTAKAAPGALSEYEILELKEAAGKNKRVFLAKVSFDESNPMNTVGGIQVFAALKSLGDVLRTDPDFEELYSDIFHPDVRYYLSTEAPQQDVEARLRIPDVVVEAVVSAVGEEAPATKMPAAMKPKAASGPTPKEAPAKQSGSRSSPAGATESDQKPGTDPDERTAARDWKKAGSVGSLLRVDSKRIDNLLNLVSETVITKAAFNQIGNQFSEALTDLAAAEAGVAERLKALMDSLPEIIEAAARGESTKDVKKTLADRYGNLFDAIDPFEARLKSTVAKFRSTAQNLGRISGELQEGVMRIRMVPISQIFSRFPRLVRDLSKSLSRKIRLVIEGEETELDKSVIEDLLDPLIHCVRNSIDHGIEDPTDRKSAGKPEEGTILLRAGNEGNMIVIEIGDDGRGIDVDAVRKRAVDRGILHPNKSLSDIEAFNLIFEAGFSTAKSVTNISGRGVGLDVVRKQIEKLNGSVTVTSERGTGSRFIIKLPLTLAIIQGLLVRVGKERYAIPITSVIDSHRIKPSDIRMLDGNEVFNVREDVVSLLRLNRLFRIAGEEQREYYYVVVVGSGDNRVGLIVDALIGEEDVVIKPLRDQFTNSPGIAGANITGDGTVSLIIDVTQLLELGLKREREVRRRRELTLG